VKVGVFSLMQWPEGLTQERVFSNEIAQAVEAERLGYDSAWFAEHHFSRYGLGPTIHLTMANVAAKTNRIRLGTAVTILPFMHPIRAAEELAVLDILSNGRIEWGVGRGYQRHEFDAFEIDISHSREMFQESLDIIFRAWQDGPVSSKGKFWNFEPVEVLPKPLQKPRIPVYQACISPSSVALAGRDGYHLQLDQFAPYDRIIEARKEYVQAWEKAGHDGPPGKTAALRQIIVGRTTEEARELAAPGLLWYYQTLANVGSPAQEGKDLPDTYEAYNLFTQLSGLSAGGESTDNFLELLLNKVAICGTAEEVTDKLTGLYEAGCKTVMTWQNFGGTPHEATIASMRRFIDDVAPNLPR